MAKYTAVVLTEESRSALRQQFRSELPPAWRIEADHMTINMGPAREGPAADRVGEMVELQVVSLAKGAKVIAAGVDSPIRTESTTPHVTLAVNEGAGGRSRDAQELTDWSPVQPLIVRGRITEVD